MVTEISNVVPGRVMEMTEFDRTAERFELSIRMAKAMAGASLLPDHLRTRRVKKAGGYVEEQLSPEEIASNCILLVNQAMRWGVDPFSLPGESYVVGGKLAFQGKLVAAVVNKRGNLKSPLRYSFSGSGDDLTVTVTGTLIGEQEPRTVTLRLGDAKTQNEMWRKDPEQKLVYSGAVRWARRHCPEVLLGVTSEDESSSEFEWIDAAAEKTTKSAPTLESALNRVFTEYRSEIEDAVSRHHLNLVVENVKADSDLTEPAKKDLVDLAKRRWADLEPEAAAAE